MPSGCDLPASDLFAVLNPPVSLCPQPGAGAGRALSPARRRRTSMWVRMHPAPTKPALAPHGCEIETDSSPELICAQGNINPAKTETCV